MRGKVFIVLMLVILIFMCIPYAPGFGFSPSKQSEFDSTPAEELDPFYDSDGDLLSDTDEREIAGTDPNDPDSDGDSFPDGQEFEYWSQRYEEQKDKEVPDWLKERYPGYSDDKIKQQYLPMGDLDRDGRPNILDPDSDGDGRPDGMEVKYELDPGDPYDEVGEDHPFYSKLKYKMGGMPTGSDSLTDRNGNFNLDEYYLDPDGMRDFQDVLFKVDPSSDPHYWRLASYTSLQSNGWYSGKYFPIYNEDAIEPDVTVFEESQNFSYGIDFIGLSRGVLPVSLHTTRVFDPDPTSQLRSADEEEFRSTSYVSSYSFNMTQYYFTRTQLLEAQSISSDLSVPYIFDIELSDLAKSIVSDQDPPFIQALDIASYLRDGFKYDIVPHEDYQNYQQYLLDFISERKIGSCTEFASAFVLLCRMNDISARFVVGFTPGEIDSDGARVVKIGHTHTWAEIRLEGLGWIPFEVSPPASDDSYTTGVGTDGDDPSVVQLLDDSGNYEFGGTGGGATTGKFSWDYYDLIDHPTLDTDGDGLNNSADSDDDNDNIPDTEEIVLGTDPLKSDTDGDGLSDGVEYFTTSTSPVNGDTDNDGIRDGKEYLEIGTDPNVADTDGGGVNDGTELTLGGDPLDESDDKEMMDSDGDGLSDATEIMIGSDPYSKDTDGGGANDMVEFLYNGNLTNPMDDLHYIDTDGDGLSDADEILIDTDKEDWDTDGGGASDGMEVTYGFDPLNRSDDYPLLDNDHDGLLNFEEAELGTNENRSDTDLGGLDDGYEVDAGLDPLDPSDDAKLDSDSDDLPDVFEQDTYNTDPFDSDSDNDGLSDGEEINLYGTDPNDADTDGDGLSDRWEVTHGLNPLAQDSDGDRLSDYLEMIYGTNPNEKDTDEDGIWDGDETHTDPLVDDTDWDGISDWLEIDSGQTDPNVPDSNFDGILDFDEYSDEDINIDWWGGERDDDGDDHMIDPKDLPFFDGEWGTAPWEPPSDPSPEPSPDETPDIDSPDPPDISSPDPDTGSVGMKSLLPILAGIAALIVISLIYMTWRKKHIEEVIDIMEDAQRTLEPMTVPDDIRAAIFQTYEELQNVLKKYGFSRRRTQTPREFKEAITAALPIPTEQIDALTALFEEARYSDHTMTIQSKNEALKNFKAIKESLKAASRSENLKRADVPSSV